MKILAIATNQGPQLSYGQTGLWLSEMTHFTSHLAELGHDIDIASPEGGNIPLDVHSTTKSQLADPANVLFMNDPDAKAKLESSLAVGDLDPDEYDVIYLSGGHGTMWDFRQSAPLQAAITQMAGAGKLITAVCHGVCGLIDSVDPSGASLIAGRELTGFSNIEDRLAGTLKQMPYRLEDELEKAGARYSKNLIPFTSRVVESGNLLTGQNPQSATALARTVQARIDARG